MTGPGASRQAGYTDIENNITYDTNGNLKTLNRAGSAVDNLTYLFTGNRLSSLTDASGNNSGVKSGTSSYSYDANGNITTDGNRGATLTYNHLNLPKTVTLNSKTYSYDYDAAGSKYKYAGDIVNIKYAGGRPSGAFEYDATNLAKRVAISEGQLVPSADTLLFDYYPFGLAIARDNPAQTNATRNGVNRYTFLGRENQPETGYMDLMKRFFDPYTR